LLRFRGRLAKRGHGDDRTGSQRQGAETKEQLAGYYLIDAQSLDQAIQVAAKIPPARVGSIEVRPVRTLSAK
jgi:hypothetical protein